MEASTVRISLAPVAMTVCRFVVETRNAKILLALLLGKLNNVLTPSEDPVACLRLPSPSPSATATVLSAPALSAETQPLKRSSRRGRGRWHDANVRRDARKTYLAARPYRCVNCGYSKRIDVCHRRPLASFSQETPLAVVNALDNLVGLCPNCHWEFDHGLLQF
jgi:5-methylcytosine-specific restriction endonuclease McrA